MGIALELKEWQKEYLSPFCLEECVDTCCCRKETNVLMTENQLRKAYGIKPGQNIAVNANYYHCGWKNQNTAVYWVSIHATKEHPHCPAYNPETKICLLENDKPEGCREFPLWIQTPLIYLSTKCDIIKTDNAIIRKLEEIAKSNSHSLKRISSPSQIKRLFSHTVMQV